VTVCERCGSACEPEELRERGGQHLCEDCYIEAASEVKTCDPWAVHLAKSDKGRGAMTLTPLQERLYELVKSLGEISIPEACRQLGLEEAALRREFATLRHLELLRATKRGTEVHLTLF
jgi:hypothetical protein